MDLISRQLLISKLANSTVKFATYDDWEHCCDVIESVEREKGEWIEDGYQDYPCVCSVCGTPQEIKAKFLFSYCPNCGSDMRKEETDG